MRHYLYDTLVLSQHQGTQITSKMLKGLSTLLEFQLEHATLKHAQTIGVVVRPQVKTLFEII